MCGRFNAMWLREYSCEMQEDISEFECLLQNESGVKIIIIIIIIIVIIIIILYTRWKH
jgi:hypothetical protein